MRFLSAHPQVQKNWPERAELYLNANFYERTLRLAYLSDKMSAIS